MTLVIELEEDQQRRLEQQATRNGMTLEEFARAALQRAMSDGDEERERQEAIALLDQWYNEPPDPDEEAGYPLRITPLSLREVTIE